MQRSFGITPTISSFNDKLKPSPSVPRFARHLIVSDARQGEQASRSSPARTAQSKRLQRFRQKGGKKTRQSLEEKLKEQKSLEDQARHLAELEEKPSSHDPAERAESEKQPAAWATGLGIQDDGFKDGEQNEKRTPMIIPEVMEEEDTEVMGEMGSMPSSRNSGQQSLEQQARDLIRKKAAILMKIMQSGADVEAAISRNIDEIDETMLQLLRRRMDAARQLERSKDVLQGIEMLYRRLKAEIDRRNATPALRLLDSLLIFYEESEFDMEHIESSNDISPLADFTSTGRMKPKSPSARFAHIRKQIGAELRQAFGSVSPQIDVLTLARELAEGGADVARNVLDVHVDPDEFIQEVGDLVESVQLQQRQLEESLDSLPNSSPERNRIEAIRNQRAVALPRVIEILSIARQIASQRI